MPLRPNTKTYAELAIAVKRLFGDESGVQLEPGDILRWANEAQQEITVRNQPLRSSATAVTVADTDTYTFPATDIYEIASLQLAGAPLPNVDYAEAERQVLASDPDKSERGRPQLWYTWGNEFWLWPVPDQAYQLALRYTRVPAKLTGSDSQILDLSDEYFPAIVSYMLWKCYEMDEDWTAAQAKQTEFENAINTHGEKEREAADMTYPVIAEVDY